MMSSVRLSFFCASLLALAGCERRPDVGPVVVSVVGTTPDAREGGNATGDRILADSVAQGLVRFDAAGQIEAGIAERWIVTDNGMSYIFRLRDALSWSDGRPLRAAEVVAILRAQIAPGSRNPLAPYLTAIDTIVEMTPQVIEIGLSRPRPDLLKLFAQPDMAIVRRGRIDGTGPFRIASRTAAAIRLTPASDPDRALDDGHAPTPEDDVLLVGERASRAITRFMARKSDLVTGGTLADWPLLSVAGAALANIRLDPAAGLFGLVVARREGFLATPENRAAVALALDRDVLTGAFAAEWRGTEQLLPEQLDSATPPTLAGWTATPTADRQRAAAAVVAAWRTRHPDPIALRVALPGGPGGTILWGRIARDLAAAGIGSERVAIDAAADLRLVDAVAPFDSARWYLAMACQPCGDEAAEAIEAARTAATLDDRAAAIARADAALAQDVAFIPIARPLRWSLVAMRLRQWAPNSRAWHPLNRLRADPR